MTIFAYRESVQGDLGSEFSGTVEVAFTDASTDLGDRQGPKARGVAVSGLAEASGARPVLMAQVHGNTIRVVDDPDSAPPTADGIITSRTQIATVVRVADCVPILLADPMHGLVAAVHAGRVGLAAGVVTAALKEMERLGAVTLRAWIGPHICGACYEVPDRMRTEVATVIPSAYATSRWGTPALDIGAGVISQLEAAECAVTVVAGCTLEEQRWHSFRRDGQTAGRMAGLVWMSHS